MEAEAVGGLDDLALRDAQLRPGAVVRRVAVRHDGVQAVVAARQLDDDEDPLGVLLDAGALRAPAPPAPRTCGSGRAAARRRRRCRRARGRESRGGSKRRPTESVSQPCLTLDLMSALPNRDSRSRLQRTLRITLAQLILRRAQHQIQQLAERPSSFSRVDRRHRRRACRGGNRRARRGPCPRACTRRNRWMK